MAFRSNAVVEKYMHTAVLLHEAVDALALWEPRIQVMRVPVTRESESGLLVSIEWVFADSVEAEMFSTRVPMRKVL